MEDLERDNTPVYDYEDAINFIVERSDINKDVIEKVLINVGRGLYA